jgi:hypothetical protein
MGSLTGLCLALRDAGDGGASASRLLLRESWRWVSKAIELGLELPSPSQPEETLAALRPPVGAILEAASIAGATDLREAAIGVLDRDGDVIACAMAALGATTGRSSPHGLRLRAVR